MEILEDQIMEMRWWLVDFVPLGQLPGHPDDISDEEVIRQIEQHYDGGSEKFVIENP